MTIRALALAPFLFALGAVAGCETTGLVETDAGPTVGDAGPELPRTLTYTPAGCGYEVRTPTVIHASAGEDVFGTGTMLDHVHVSFVGPTDTSFAVNWRSDEETLASSVLVGTDQAAVAAADGATAGVELVTGHQLLYSANASGRDPTRVHEVHVCGLAPDTTYYYRVGGPGHWSETFEVSTGPALGSTDPWSFGVTGDSRGNEEDSWTISQRRLHDAGVDFEIFSGDAVVIGTVQTQWDQFLGATLADFGVEDFLASRPLMMANGNHDNLSVNYLAQFALPQDVSDGEVAQGEEWYSFDYGNAHFVSLNDTVLDSGVLGGEEAAWLRADLTAVDRAVTPWVFVFHHRPLYTCQSTHAPDTSLRSNWQPIFDEFHVDIVFAGHNHVYERSEAIFGLEGGQGVVAPHDSATGAPLFDTGVASGTVYVVAAGVGAPLYPVETSCPTSREGLSVRNYVVVEIAGDAFEMTVRNALTDDVIDTLTYTR